MNVSMMDSYNLSWKLTHALHDLIPKPPEERKGSPDSILATYALECLSIAHQLDFDSKFSSMFSGRIGPVDPSLEALTHEQFLKVFSDGGGFTSGCGVEYPEQGNVLVQSGGDRAVQGEDYLLGTLKPGRRLLDTVVRRYADANVRHLQHGRLR
jgi:phenol 2-monooxygenase